MIEWANESPWFTFFIVLATLTALENIVKRVFKCSGFISKEEADSFLEDSSRIIGAKDIRIKNLEMALHLAKVDLERYKQLLYEAHELQRNSDRNRYHQKAEEAQRRTREARDFGGRSQHEPHFTGFGGAKTQQQKPSWNEIKAKYRREVKENHPDLVRAKGGSEQDVKDATIVTQALNEQYAKDKARYGK